MTRCHVALGPARRVSGRRGRDVAARVDVGVGEEVYVLLALPEHDLEPGDEPDDPHAREDPGEDGREDRLEGEGCRREDGDPDGAGEEAARDGSRQRYATGAIGQRPGGRLAEKQPSPVGDEREAADPGSEGEADTGRRRVGTCDDRPDEAQHGESEADAGQGEPLVRDPVDGRLHAASLTGGSARWLRRARRAGPRERVLRAASRAWRS